MLEILRQAVEFEVLGNAAHAPWLGLGLERAQHHLARVGLVIGTLIGHPQNRQMSKAVNRFRQQVKVLTGMQRQRDPRLRRQIAPPHAPAVHDHIRRDMPRLSIDLVIDARHLPPIIGHGGHLDPLDDLRALHPGTLGQRHGDVRRIALPVARKMHRRHHVIDIQKRVQLLDYIGADLFNLDIECARQCGLPQDLFLAMLGQRDGQRAHLPHARRNARLLLKPVVEVRRILREPRHVLVRAQLPDKPRRMPRRTAGQNLSLKEDNVRPPSLRQVIGHRTARHPTTDDNRARL